MFSKGENLPARVQGQRAPISLLAQPLEPTMSSSLSELLKQRQALNTQTAAVKKSKRKEVIARIQGGVLLDVRFWTQTAAMVHASLRGGAPLQGA